MDLEFARWASAHETPAAHLLLLLLVPLAIYVYRLLRRRQLKAETQLLLAITTAGATWAIVLTWSMFKPARVSAPDAAFQSVEYLVREVPAEWWLNDLVVALGWTIGLALFGACWLLARFVRRS